MPRKTNKTAHVLNLLSVGAGVEEPTETTETDESASNISLVESPTGTDDPLADLIKDTLSKEVLGEEAALVDDVASTEDVGGPKPRPVSEPDATADEPAPEPEPEPIPEPVPVAAPAPEPIPDPTPVVVPTPEPAPDPTPVAVPTPEPIPEPTPVVVSKPEPTPDPTPVVVSTPEPTPDPTPVVVPTPEPIPVSAPAPAPEPEVDYVSINVMNVLVDDKVKEYMRKFDTCTCPRCEADIKALALSNLPPKYMVMPKASRAPLMSFYSNKFQFNLITELTKACLDVINHPRH